MMLKAVHKLYFLPPIRARSLARCRQIHLGKSVEAEAADRSCIVTTTTAATPVLNAEKVESVRLTSCC